MSDGAALLLGEEVDAEDPEDLVPDEEDEPEGTGNVEVTTGDVAEGVTVAVPTSTVI